MDDADLYDFARSGATANNVSQLKCHHTSLTLTHTCIEIDFTIHRRHECPSEQIPEIGRCQGT